MIVGVTAATTATPFSAPLKHRHRELRRHGRSVSRQAKLVLIGEGMAGKTSLWHSLLRCHAADAMRAAAISVDACGCAPTASCA